MKIRKVAQTPGLLATVVDNLNSDSTTDALSAKQGKVLKEMIDNIDIGEETGAPEIAIGSEEPTGEEVLWINEEDEVEPEDVDLRQIVTTGLEFATNEWIDGKRVYGKRMNLGKGAASGSQKGYNLSQYGISDAGMTYVRHDCVGINGDFSFSLPILIGNEYDTYIWFNGNIESFLLRNGTATDNVDADIILTLYYTKKTE